MNLPRKLLAVASISGSVWSFALSPKTIAAELGVSCESRSDCYGNPTPGVEGHCVNHRCSESDCADGFCGNNFGLCVALLSWGGQCVVDAECTSGYCRDAHCCAEDCVTGYCGAVLDGADGVCRPLLPVASICDFDGECYTGVCDRFDGVCCRDYCSNLQTCNSPWSPGRCSPYATNCIADCDGDGSIAISELITAVSIGLGLRSKDDCRNLDHDENGRITVDELIVAVQQAMTECSEG